MCLDSTTVALLSIKSLSVNFGGLQALDDVHLTVEHNSVTSIIGPNGAGKTTLFNVISGLVKPHSGSIQFHEKDIPWPNAHELASLRIARTLQGVGLFTGLTVMENVMIGCDIHRRSNVLKDAFGFSHGNEEELRDRARDALAWAGALALADKTISELPYPDSKRVALARALAMEPELILLDEPAAGLGQSEIDALGELIHGVKRRCSVMLVEHHVDFVGDISDDVYVLNFGKVIASGSFDTVKRDPAVVAAYLGTTTDSTLGGVHA